MGELVKFESSSSDRKFAQIGTFKDKFSVVGEISFHRQDYSGGENMTMSSVPMYISMGLERVQHRVSKPMVGLSPIIVCCISHGLKIIESDADIIALLELRQKFNMMDDLESDLAESVHAWFRLIPLSVPDVSLSGMARLSFRIPELLKASLHAKAVSIGIPTQTLALVCVLEALRHERAILVNHRKYMGISLVGFMRRIKIHKVVAGALVEVLSSGGVGLCDLKKMSIELGEGLKKIEVDSEDADKVRTLIEACESFSHNHR